MFTNSALGTPEAAAMLRSDSLANPGEIKLLVEQGCMVRARSDADLFEGRNGDTTRREAALASGAQFISTDFAVANVAGGFTDYQVMIPGGTVARSNPLNATDICSSGAL